MNRKQWCLHHFRACPSCEAFGGARARKLSDRGEDDFCVEIFKCFHPNCYSQHLYRGLFFGYEPATSAPIPPFSHDNYASLYDPAFHRSLVKAWTKQLRVVNLFARGDSSYVSPLTLATRFIDHWEAQLTGKPVKARVCFDASRGINPCLKPWKFRYNDFPYILNHLQQGDWVAQVDLRNWYLQLSIRRAFQKYLSLRCPLTNELIRYCALPFGLSTAPGWASAISSELTRIVRACGVDCVIEYLDDLHIIASSQKDAQLALIITLQVLNSLGVEVAPEKVTHPTQLPTILGHVVDTVNMTISVRQEHLEWALRCVRSVLKRKRISRRKAQSLAGMLNWIAPMLKGSRPYLRSAWDLFRSRARAFKVPDYFLQDMRWWRSAMLRLQRHHGATSWVDASKRPTTIMFSDASGDLGAGVWVGDFVYSHQWSDEQKLWSVPHKELFPIVVTAQNLGSQLKGKILVAATDSATNVFAINAGSSRSPECNKLLKRLSKLERQFDFDVVATWCPREFNFITDQLSKLIIIGAPLVHTNLVSPSFQ